MGKTKAVKKPSSSPLKISTSLFRRKSKNSSGQVDKELPAAGKSGKGKVVKNKGGSPKGKVGNKEGSKQSSSTASSASSSPSSSSGGAATKQKKTAAITTTTTKKGSEGKLTQGKKNKKGATPNTTTKKATGKAVKVKGKPSQTSASEKSKASAKNKDSEKSPVRRKDKSPSPRPKGRSSSNSNSSSSSSNSSSSNSSVEKITTRKRSKSDADSPPSPVQKKMAKNEEGESTTKQNSKNTTAATNKKGGKANVIKTKNTTTTSAAKVTKKATASIVASKKKKLPVKLEKAAAAKTKGTTTKLDKSKNKPVQKTGANKTKSISSKGTKSKVKPRPKIKLKRMASLNAKAILEASFSFEPQEKKQRSPAPSLSSVISKVKNMDEVHAGVVIVGKEGSSNRKPIIGSSSTSTGTQKGNDDVIMMPKSTISTSTSPPPPSIPNTIGKVGGERKRKSSETPSRRESATSNKSASSKGKSNVANHLITTTSSSNTSTPGSRRNSASGGGGGPPAVDSSGMTKVSKKSKKDSLNPKKKTKVSTSTTSTSTSPLPSPEFYPEQLRKSKHKHKHKKSVGVDSGTNTTSSGDKNQDSGIQVEYESHPPQSSSIKLKSVSAGCQAKEKKSSTPTPVAHFGTVYQPAGPLIEPHKSVPAGLLPETVKLPPDLKVTYQTHPPTSNAPTVVSHSSSSKASKKHANSSSASTSTTSHRKSEKIGQILHQPYKSSMPSSSTGSPSMSRPIQPNYPGVSYVSAATGSPLLSSHSSLLSQQQSAAVVQQQQHHQLAGLTMTGHHGLSSSGSISVGPSHQPQLSASAGASSAGGLFYSQSSGFAPHHSPFAPCKYPMVPPDSYRTHSPYPNSFLYPPTTPQPSQSYFMTPFYTPPLTPNSTPGTVLGSQSRSLPLAAHHHHPSAAAASFYQPHSGPLPPSAHLHPSNYLISNPHHSIQSAPQGPPGVPPGHAGLLVHPNQSTQPACPCPTESCQLNNTNNNKPQQQQQCVSSVSLLAPEAGAKQPKLQLQSQQALVSTNVTRPSRHFSTTPAVAADPPVTIKLLNSNIDVRQSQARQLESAKTFTEQYSLPDDITITPIIVTSPNTNALLLMGPSISITATSAPSSSVTSSSTTNASSRILTGNSSKKKEKDIVHVIDPRSGQRTTIAKHISNKNLLANSTNKNNSRSSANKNSGQTAVSRLKPSINNKLGAVSVGKLNPDLDVIVINNSGSSSGDCISENGKLLQEQAKAKHASQLAMNNSKTNKRCNSAIPNPSNHGNSKKGNKMVSQSLSNRRIALADNDNNNRKIAPKKADKSSEKPSVPFQSTVSSFNYSLPPGISISAGTGTNLSITSSSLNPVVPRMQNRNQSLNLSMKPMTVQNFQKSDSQNQKLGSTDSKSKKRISLNDCIDELQKKRLKLLESPHAHTNGTSESINGNANMPLSNGRSKSAGGLSSSHRGAIVKDTATSARVRDPELNLGSTVINSSDAVVAVSAVFLDPHSYQLSRNTRTASSTKGLNKNGLKKAKLQQSKRNLITAPVSGKKSSNHKLKIKPLEKVISSTIRNTRSTAANAKIRTRLSAKPKSGGINPADPNQACSRSRSRLLRKRNQFISPNNRKSESDCSSNCTSRSNSAIRIVSGNGPNGRLEKERVNKYPSQAFINAVADLYQYRRNVMLRIPKSGVGIFPSASNVNLFNLPESPSPDSIKGVLSPVQDKQKIQQLSPNTPHAFHNNHKSAFGSSSRSSSPMLQAGSSGTSNKIPLGSMAANAAKKRAMVKPLSPASINGALQQMAMLRRQPKWSNGWRFEGEPYESKVLVNNDDQAVIRRCYPAMRHESGDVLMTRDCVLLKSGSRKNDLPYIAKIAALWENPGDGEMMFSLLWYYRPEHTDMGRTREDMPDEIFASKHIDVNSVATIDDRCYVLTYNEYCRYRKQMKQLEHGLPNKPLISLKGSSMVNNNAAGSIAGAVWSGRSLDPNNGPVPGKISPEVVFFCRKVYDFRQKRIMKNPS